MTLPTRARWWPLRNRQNFLIVNVVIMELAMVSFALVSESADLSTLRASSILVIVGVAGLGGLTWSLVVWELFLKSRAMPDASAD
jgi:hypothetical protein